MGDEEVGGEMVAVLNEGEVCSLLDGWDERIIGFAFFVRGCVLVALAGIGVASRCLLLLPFGFDRDC